MSQQTQFDMMQALFDFVDAVGLRGMDDLVEPPTPRPHLVTSMQKGMEKLAELPVNCRMLKAA